MKTLVTSFLLLTLTTLLVKAQAQADLNYGDIIERMFNKSDTEGRTFQPQLEHLQADTVSLTNLSPKDVDGSGVAATRLTFSAEETLCGGTQVGPCPPKDNGQLLLCTLVLRHPVQDISNVIASEMSCEKVEPEDLNPKIRRKRFVHHIRRWWGKAKDWFSRVKDKAKDWYQRRVHPHVTRVRDWVRDNGDHVKNHVVGILG